MAASGAVLLLVSLHLPKLLHCAQHYVKADPFSICTTGFEPCFTLNEYLKNSTMLFYFTSGSTFTLLQGQHHLNETLALSGVTGITFRGQGPETSTLSIAEGGKMKWKNSQDIMISSLRIKYEGETTNPAALVVEHSTLQMLNVQFTGGGNRVGDSQGMRVVNSTTNFVNCSFTNWCGGHNGGAVYMNASNATFSGISTFTNNKAHTGGAVYLNVSRVTFSGISTFSNNMANDGGAAYVDYASNVTFFGISTLTNNMANRFGGGIAILEESSSGCLCTRLRSNIVFNGSCTFKSNQASSGGGVYVRRSTLRLHTDIIFTNNTALNLGGAIVAKWQSRIYCKGNVRFISNLAQNSGGLRILDSVMNCSGNVTFKNNQASQLGGGIHATSSTIALTGNYSFLENIATDGGGMALEEMSYHGRRTKVVLHSPVTINFSSNRAISKGGGLLFDTYSCAAYCFFQIEAESFFPLQNVQLNFRANSAGLSGSALYGGFPKNCSIEVNNITNSTLSNIVKIYSNETFSSDPVKICLCNFNLHTILDCNPSNTRIIHVSPGIDFNMSIVVLGLGDVPVNSTIQAYIINERSTTIHPKSHTIEGQCTNITLQLFTEDTANKTLVLEPHSHCYTNHTSLVILECPAGFTFNNSQCKCSENELIEAGVIKCADNNNMLQIERQGNSWIDIVNMSGKLNFIYHPECPLNYCRPSTENILLSFSDYNSNILCSTNRTGMLCGECMEGYSLTLNKFNCKECDNEFISLLVFFVFAGLAITAVLLALHMTVAAGTINGLILYANIVNVNSFIFFPPQSSNKFTSFLTVFISWLNLDLGIETCFFSGLNFYTYAWLEYVFPLYLWLLIGAIIISSRFSAKIGKLFGSNPVAVLATVLLMSYTKLFQATTISLTFTSMQYSDRQSKNVWLYQASISYFGNKHVFLGLTAFCMIVFLLLPFTFLLLFGYRLQTFSTKRAFSWLNKIKPLLDAYYAPYRAKARYWPGLMLLVRGCLYAPFSATSISANLVAVSSVFSTIALMPWLGHRVYENLYNDILEASFILNICLLTTATFHVNYTNDSYRMKAANQEIAITLSIGIAFLQFLGILCFHLYLRLKNIKLCALLRRRVEKSLLHPKESEEEPPSTVKEVTMTVMDLREPLLESQPAVTSL